MISVDVQDPKRVYTIDSGDVATLNIVTEGEADVSIFFKDVDVDILLAIEYQARAIRKKFTTDKWKNKNR